MEKKEIKKKKKNEKKKVKKKKMRREKARRVCQRIGEIQRACGLRCAARPLKLRLSFYEMETTPLGSFIGYLFRAYVLQFFS